MTTVKTDVQDINETRKSISVRVTAEEIAQQENAVIKDFQKHVRIPGFRPGKAPEAMVRSRHAKDLKQELKKRVLSKAHEEGVGKSELSVYGIVDVKEGDIEVGADAVITFTVDIFPDFELPEYTGLKVTNAPTDASEAEIDQMLDQILSQRAEYNVVEKAADKGDYVRCSYEGKIGDELVADIVPDAPMYGTQKVTWEEAGSETAPGVRAVVDGLVGMKAGDEKEVTMEFPADFQPEALAGKTVVYALKAEEVREKVLPEMDEAFFKSVQVKDADELRNRIRENIEGRKKQENSNSERQQITEYLLKSVDFPVPQSGVEDETDEVLRDFMQRNMQRGVSAEEFEKHKEELHDGASKAAVNRLKSRLILSKIAEKEKIKIENDDFSRLIMMEAQQTGKKPEKLVKELKGDQIKLNRMRREIFLGKAMDLLVQKAERTVVDAPQAAEPAEPVAEAAAEK